MKNCKEALTLRIEKKVDRNKLEVLKHVIGNPSVGIFCSR